VLAGAIGRYVIRERENLRIPTIAHNQIGEPVSPRTPAFRTLDPQHTELADQVAEDDRAELDQSHSLSKKSPPCAHSCRMARSFARQSL